MRHLFSTVIGLHIILPCMLTCLLAKYSNTTLTVTVTSLNLHYIDLMMITSKTVSVICS